MRQDDARSCQDLHLRRDAATRDRLGLGRKDSNPRSRDQNPLPYHLATPQCASKSTGLVAASARVVDGEPAEQLLHPRGAQRAGVASSTSRRCRRARRPRRSPAAAAARRPGAAAGPTRTRPSSPMPPMSADSIGPVIPRRRPIELRTTASIASADAAPDAHRLHASRSSANCRRLPMKPGISRSITAGSLPPRAHGVARPRQHVGRRLAAAAHLDQRDQLRRVPEVRRDHPLAMRDLAVHLASRRSARRRQHRGRRADAVELREQLHLQRHVVRHGLDHQLRGRGVLEAGRRPDPPDRRLGLSPR